MLTTTRITQKELQAQGCKIAVLAAQLLTEMEITRDSEDLVWGIYRDGQRVGGFRFDEVWFRTEVSRHTDNVHAPLPVDLATRRRVAQVLNWAIALVVRGEA